MLALLDQINISQTKVCERVLMTNPHQKISGYSGSLYGEPHYQGIEYDWEVPDDTVVGSPGGLATRFHHYTKGFYGRGETSSDVYGGQQQIYNTGIYGNLYQSGQTAPQAMGYYSAAPDYQFWQNEEPQQYSYSHQPGDAPLPGSPILHGFPQKKASASGVEGFDFDPTFELIESDASLVPTSSAIPGETSPGTEVSMQTKITPWALLLIVFVIFLVFYLWVKTGDRFMVQYLHDGKRPSWKRMAVYSLVATIILCLILYFSGFPIMTFES